MAAGAPPGCAIRYRRARLLAAFLTRRRVRLLFERAPRRARAIHKTAHLCGAGEASSSDKEWCREHLPHQRADARLRRGFRTGVRAEIAILARTRAHGSFSSASMAANNA